MANVSNRFNFLIITEAQYKALATKNPMTFYLSLEGKGWLGNVALFDGSDSKLKIIGEGATLTNPLQGTLYLMQGSTFGDKTDYLGLYFYDGTTLVSYSDKIIAAYIAKILTTNMTADGYTGDDATIPTTKAVVDAIDAKLAGEAILSAKFFRSVKSHTLTEADIADTNISKPEDAVVGEVGLLFTADNDMVDGGESFYFISLKNYITIYEFNNSSSINMTKTADGMNVSADLRVKTTEKAILVDATEGAEGVYLNTTALAGGVNDEAASNDRLVTEKDFVDYIVAQVLPAIDKAVKDALADVVTWDTHVEEPIV